MAIGSCAAGAVRRYVETHGLADDDFDIDVTYQPSRAGAARLMIVIDVSLSPALAGQASAIEVIATTGQVTSRICLGSEVTVHTHIKVEASPPPAVTKDAP